MSKNPPDLTGLYQPDEHSFAGRVLQLMVRNPDEEYTSADLASKFDIKSSAVHPLLQPAVQHSLLAWVLPEGESIMVWRAGSDLMHWHARRQQAQQHQAEGAAAVKRRGRGGKQTQLPPLLPSQVQFHAEREKPLVERRGPGGQPISRYQWIFDQLHAKPVGASAVLPHQYLGTIGSLAKKRQKAGLGKYTVRRISLDSMEIWRDA